MHRGLPTGEVCPPISLKYTCIDFVDRLVARHEFLLRPSTYNRLVGQREHGARGMWVLRAYRWTEGQFGGRSGDLCRHSWWWEEDATFDMGAASTDVQALA